MNRTPGENYPLQIKKLRAELGLTQVALAKAIGVSFPTVNRWENGKTRPSQVCWSRLMELIEESKRTNHDEAPAPVPIDNTSSVLDFTTKPGFVRTLVEGERLSFGHLSNPAFATEIANIDPLPHQRIAVYDHMLPQFRLRFLLADDAGAGKTIMTGLYLREMLSRRLIRRVLIVTPAGLVGNWQRELATLFHLRFDIISGNDARSKNPFQGNRGNQLIVSIDTLAGKKVYARLKENGVEPYELVVFDEAHKLSCDRDADLHIRKTARYCLAEAIAGVHDAALEWRLPWQTHHLLLLTATPHMGKDYPYYALWRLLEPEALAAYEAFHQFPDEKRKQHFIRRTKEEMVNFKGQPLYPKRMADTLAYDLNQGDESEQRLYEKTTDYLRFVYNKAKLLNRSAARLAMGVFQRRLASSTHALLCSFDRRIEKLDKTIDDVRTGRLTMEQLLNLQRRISETEDVLEFKTADEESGQNGLEENQIAEERLLQGVAAASIADLIAEKEIVKGLRDIARRVCDKGGGAKFDRLHGIISDSRFSSEKLIVFTEHRDTLDFLVRRLSSMGYTDQIATIHGGMHHTERQNQVEQFRKPTDDGGARFMICTDAAAEGINLQFCWIMINYDIPWNPARLEQRMGRIHRYGQKHDPVVILNLVAPSTREGRVLKTLLDKIEKIRGQLKNDKVYDSIGRIFTNISIRRYMEMALEGSTDDIVRQLDGLITKEKVKAAAQREHAVYGQASDVQKELPRLKESIEAETFFRLLPGFVRRFIESASPLVGIDIDGDLGGYFRFRDARKGAVDPLLSPLETYPANQRRRLSALKPNDQQSCVWIHPGEPVFEGFRDIVRNRLGPDALRGAIFIDPTATRPYLFHLARLTVVRQADPENEDLGREETVECRLVGIRQFEGSEISLCPVEHLLLLRGGTGLSPEAQRLAVIAKQHRNLAQAYLTERVARTMAVERRSRLLETLAEREAFIKRGFDFQEADLAGARARLSKKAQKGNRAAARHLAEIKAQQRFLSLRRQRALDVLRREPELIVPGETKFIAHALVVPTADRAEKENLQAGVENIAMDLARAYEEAAGAKVQLVHTPELARSAGLPDHPGFDILSVRPGNQRRCIEVKGRAATGEIEITDNEWARACNLRSDYWLYAVYHCGAPTPQMVRVQDPFEKLLIRPFTRTRIVESVREISGARISHRQIMKVGEM